MNKKYKRYKCMNNYLKSLNTIVNEVFIKNLSNFRTNVKISLK